MKAAASGVWQGPARESLLDEWDMGWATPQYDRDLVDEAGRVLIDPPDFYDDNEEFIGEAWDEYDHALTVINNWRSSHSFPLNTFQVSLRRHAQEIDGTALVAQRIKRLPSIGAKLRRFDWLTLSEMQDIGGCRAVLRSVRHVERLVEYYEDSGFKHKLADSDDYVEEPKRSGYRGYHLIYQYFSDRKTTYNGLKIEVQIRSQLQHAWATAVETVDTFTKQALKSSRGDEKWRRFFRLMGSAIARRENAPLVPGTPTTKRELVAELRELTRELDVENHLRAYGDALRELGHPSRNAHYFLLKLEPVARQLTVTGFKFDELQLASQEYLNVERQLATNNDDAVLVSVDSVESLRRAYPNYFLDTHMFIAALHEALGRRPPRR